MAKSGWSQRFSENFVRIAGKFAGNKFLLTLRDSFVLVSATTMIAGFAIMIGAVFVDPANGLIFGQQGLQLGKFISGSYSSWSHSGIFASLTSAQGLLNLISNGSLNILSLLIAIVFAYKVSQNYFPEQSEHMVSVLYAVGAFMLVLPWHVLYANGKQTIDVQGVLNSGLIGTQGVFSALIVSGVSVWLYNTLSRKNVTIKLPESVPPAVAKSFESLIPGVLTMLFWIVLTGIANSLAHQTLPELLLTFLQKPALAVSSTAAFAFVSQLTWPLLQWFGIHPTSIWGAIYGLTWNVNDTQNMLGQAHHLYSTMFMNFSTIAAGTFALAPVLAVLLVGRQASDRQITKIGLMPAIFNISEPITFGLPIVLNPIYFIPFVVVQPLTFYIAVFFTKIGFIPIISNNVPWTVPPILSGLLFTGSINGAIVQVINLAVATLIYVPFVLTANKIAQRKQQEI